MKLSKQIIVLSLLLLLVGCRTFKNEAKRSIKSDVKEYLSEPQGRDQVNAYIRAFNDREFDSYARAYGTKKIVKYKERLSWTLKVISVTLGIIASSGGLVILNRKLKKNNENV